MTTPVIYRKDPDGSVFALFPTIPGDAAGLYVTCYQHVGQHSQADLTGCIADSRPATPAEYADLHSELISLGYDDLEPRRRASRAMRAKLVAELAKATTP